MKKISALLLGASLSLATAGLMLAAQATTPAPNSGTKATTARKHVKKNKKAATNGSAAKAAAPATK